MTYNYYSVHDIIKIKTNMEVPIPDYFRNEKELEPDIEFVQEDLDVDTPVGNKAKTRNFFYWEEGQTLLIDYQAPFLNAKLVIDNLEGKTKIKFTKAFGKYGRMSIPIRPIIEMKLIQKGFALIHSGCLYHNGQCFLFTATRDTGKTSTVLSLLDGKDFKFMSDDLTIISKSGSAYSYPEKVDISPHTLTGSVVPPYGNKIKSRLAKSHFVTLISGRLFNLELTELREIPHNLVEDKGSIKKVFILVGGSNKAEVKQIDNAEAAKKIISSTIELINPSKEYLLNLYSYVCDFDIVDLIVKEKKITEMAISDAECFEVSSNRVEKYPEMIKEVIRSE
ncbi:hypothetical protein FHEFKHOI_00641 [Candidatus Methanoperedenaceae archaeon GB50]|nr:hypothetical protein FHEFKHOI_00641 [Candidatus Methanoperedenaceae archaeon GB50]CAD7778469.1 MAG: hypothetical protein KBONHNOK_01149 [Candidatus Methanoperedenaceae archaeon GB50]